MEVSLIDGEVSNLDNVSKLRNKAIATNCVYKDINGITLLRKEKHIENFESTEIKDLKFIEFFNENFSTKVLNSEQLYSLIRQLENKDIILISEHILKFALDISASDFSILRFFRNMPLLVDILRNEHYNEIETIQLDNFDTRLIASENMLNKMPKVAIDTVGRAIKSRMGFNSKKFLINQFSEYNKKPSVYRL